MLEVLLCQKFLPEHGGTVRWMYEAYRRWPHPVEVVTHNYYDYPPRTPSFPNQPQRPESGDHASHPNLTMDRRDIFLHNWGFDQPSRIVRYGRMMQAIKERLDRRPKQIVRVHCIHAVPEATSLWPLKQMYGKRLQVVSYAHGEEITACRSSRQLTFLMMRAHSVIDLMLANSRYTQNVAKDYIDPAKIRIINPGVDISEFAQAPELGRAWREKHGYQNRQIVMTLGRLDGRKNHQAVLEAVGQLASRYPDLLYILAGEGGKKESLQKRAAELNLQDRVIFTGSIDGQLKLALYGGCDVFAMPAIRDGTDVEGFGMVFLEAGACGKPVIAGIEGGQPDAVSHEQTGLLVDGTNQQQVTDALDRLLADASLRQRLGDQGQAWAQRFDWPQIVNRTVQVINATLPGD